MFKINSMAYEVPLVSGRYAERFVEFMEGRGISATNRTDAPK